MKSITKINRGHLTEKAKAIQVKLQLNKMTKDSNLLRDQRMFGQNNHPQLRITGHCKSIC